MEFLRDKFYYVVAIFGVFLILMIILFSCSLNKTTTNYDKLENKMIEGTKKYLNAKPKELPKTEGDVISIKTSYLINNGYMKEMKDPKNKKKTCSGTVEVEKRGDSYKYTPLLTCNSYKTKLLVDKLKTSLKLDNNGNGLYAENGEYVFKGEDLKNYIKFNNELWQVMRIDKDGDIKVIKNKAEDDEYVWDDRYNTSSEGKDGINDFKLSRIKTTLDKYYKNHFNAVHEAKESVVKKPFCIGKRNEKDDIKGTAECLSTMDMYVGLIYASEFYMASLDSTCKSFGQKQCSNYNYLAKNENSSWTLTGSKTQTFRVYAFYEDEMYDINASDSSRIYPVIYLDSKMTVTGGKGTDTDPYIVK